MPERLDSLKKTPPDLIEYHPTADFRELSGNKRRWCNITVKNKNKWTVTKEKHYHDIKTVEENAWLILGLSKWFAAIHTTQRPIRRKPDIMFSNNSSFIVNQSRKTVQSQLNVCMVRCVENPRCAKTRAHFLNKTLDTDQKLKSRALPFYTNAKTYLHCVLNSQHLFHLLKDSLQLPGITTAGTHYKTVRFSVNHSRHNRTSSTTKDVTQSRLSSPRHQCVLIR